MSCLPSKCQSNLFDFCSPVFSQAFVIFSQFDFGFHEFRKYLLNDRTTKERKSMKKFDDDLEFESLNDEPRDTRFILPIIVVSPDSATFPADNSAVTSTLAPVSVPFAQMC